MLQNLLDYWRNIELFQPGWPVNEKIDINLEKASLPWQEASHDEDIQIIYDIYLGRAVSYDLIAWMLEHLKIKDDSPIERDQAPSCLCAFQVDEDGMYIPDSFAISCFAWALGQLAKTERLDAKLEITELNKLQIKINAQLSERESAFSLAELQAIISQSCVEISLDTGLFSPTVWSKKKVYRRKKDKTFPQPEPVELVPSFYLNDIALVQENPTSQTQQYAEALCGHLPDRTQIDSDVEAMKDWLSADRFPMGNWPSRHSPSLMQQLAINLSISGHEMFSVNGPPGTGKTTLLKEVVAANIVKRAALMTAYSKPDDAFQKETFIIPPDQFNQTFYRPDKSLTAFGMLVASNNNAAVENISIELPKAIDKDRTGLFSSASPEESTNYFADVATDLLGEPAWGLISARLGKKSNLSALKDRLWWSKQGSTLKQYYDETTPELAQASWAAAVADFKAAWADVINARENIAKAQTLLPHQAAVQRTFNSARSELENAKAGVAAAEKALEAAQTESLRLEAEHALLAENIDSLRSGLSGIKRLFSGLYKRNPVVRELKETEAAAGKILVAITRQRTETQHAQHAADSARQLAQKRQDERNTALDRLNAVTSDLEAQRERFGANFADAAFWQDICSNETSQSACPWTHEEYDALRETLFHRALMVQKAFVLASNAVKQNLGRLWNMWDGKFGLQDRSLAYGSLLNTLFFVVPVLSTTFASVQSFLDGISAGELGLLVVDESGQATPQSALGALWRTQRAIVVGDPLQVEPIMTTPMELRKRFAEDNALPSIYRIPELSVQMLADARNPYGGYRDMGSQALWLGCPLVVHRRCIEPMFSMSNDVAYNGRMFRKTQEPKADMPLQLSASVWFDVPGAEIGHKNHTVTEQVDLLVKLLGKAVVQTGNMPNFYIITPFKSVERALKKELQIQMPKWLPDSSKDVINDWLKENCGTIHTFQGKEADEVLLVLGCDSQSGMGAARWVGQKPNIINVAVSRAKYRLGVIGDYNLWKNIPYVQTVAHMLKGNIIR